MFKLLAMLNNFKKIILIVSPDCGSAAVQDGGDRYQGWEGAQARLRHQC